MEFQGKEPRDVSSYYSQLGLIGTSVVQYQCKEVPISPIGRSNLLAVRAERSGATFCLTSIVKMAVRSGHQGIKEFFVRDAWKDCQGVCEYVRRFQSAKKSIAGIIEASTHIRLISIDKKNTLKLTDFLDQQAKTQSSALVTLEGHYQEIVAHLQAIGEVGPLLSPFIRP